MRRRLPWYQPQQGVAMRRDGQQQPGLRRNVGHVEFGFGSFRGVEREDAPAAVKVEAHVGKAVGAVGIAEEQQALLACVAHLVDECVRRRTVCLAQGNGTHGFERAQQFGASNGTCSATASRSPGALDGTASTRVGASPSMTTRPPCRAKPMRRCSVVPRIVRRPGTTMTS